MLTELKNRDFYTKTIHLMLPIVLQQALTWGINLLDGLMVGTFGEISISAVSLSNQYVGVFLFLSAGLGSGASVMASQFWGAKDRQSLHTVAAIALRVAIAVSALFGLVSFVFAEQILRLLTNDAAIVAEGVPYLQIVAVSFLFTGLSTSTTNLLRSVRHVRIPFIASIIAFVLNVFFNWALIFGKLGMPALGVAGAAWGTLIARVFEVALIFGYFIFKDPIYGFRFRGFAVPGGALSRTYAKYSLPVLVSDAFIGVGMAAGSAIIGHISAEFIAATAIIHNANQVLSILNMSMSNASGIVIGNTVGEGDSDRAYREGSAYLLLSFLIGLILSLLIIVLDDAYLSLYNVTAATRETAQSLMLFLII